MCEMSAVREIHPENSIARFEESIVDTDIGSSTRKSLDIGMISMENLFRSLDSNRLHLIRELLSAVVALSWEALCIFIHEDTSKCFLDCGRSVVFRGDEFHAIVFTQEFSFDCGKYSRVCDFEGEIRKHK